MITIKSDDELQKMREAGRIAAEVLQMLADQVRPGVPTKDLDKTVRREFARRNVRSPFLNYAPRGKVPYPAMVCVSVNDELVHGIPGKRVLRDGDIVSIDLGTIFPADNGYVGDTAVTVPCGSITAEARRLIDVTRESLKRGIAAARAGARLGEVSNAIGTYIEENGFSVVREYVGHGVGREMHEEPQVPNFGPPDRGPVLRKGMVLALEPMVAVGDWRTKELGDGWTVGMMDGSLCAHFEHTIAITDSEAEILTLP